MVNIVVYKRTQSGYDVMIGQRVADDFEIRDVLCADGRTRKELILIYDNRRHGSYFLGSTIVGNLWYCIVKDSDGNVILDSRFGDREIKPHEGLLEFDEYGREIDAI